MSNDKRNGGIFAGKGYYIALVLCALAIGTTGYAVYRNTTQEQPVSLEESVAEELPALAEDEEDIPVLATKGQESEPTKPPVQPTEPAPKKRL